MNISQNDHIRVTDHKHIHDYNTAHQQGSAVNIAAIETVNRWKQPPLSSNKNMMLFLLYLQSSDTSTVFSPNGNKDAMIFCSKCVVRCFSTHIVMLVLLIIQHFALCIC